MTREEAIDKELDELQGEFLKVNLPLMEKMTLFAKVQNAVRYVADLPPVEPQTCTTCEHSNEVDGEHCYECVKGMENNFEPCEDAISRKEALECFPMIMQGMGEYTALAIRNKLRKLPSVKVEQTEWISVKDRLPELGQMVLVTYADGDVETNERMTLKNLEVWKYGNSVVAWMPLPSPYKGE